MSTRQPIGHLATCPQVLASTALMYEAMDDTTSFNYALVDRLRDDQIEALTDKADADAKAAALADMQHEMRSLWADALDHMHALSTPKLPTVDGNKVRMVPVTELVGTLMDAQWSVHLLADALRTDDTTKLHIHLRTMWVDGYAADLVRLEWTA